MDRTKSMNLRAYRTAGRTVTATVLATAFFFSLPGGAQAEAAHAVSAQVHTTAPAFTTLLHVLPPCASDGESWAFCGWDARHRGNGHGTSFVQLGAVVISA